MPTHTIRTDFHSNKIMNTQLNSQNCRILQSTTRLNSKEASQFNFCGSPIILGRHTGESPATSTLSLASSRVVSDLPAYIIFSRKHCLEMTTRNSKPRATRKAVNSDLQEILAPLFDLDSAPGHALALLELLHHSTITDAIEHSNAAETITAIAIALKKLEKLKNPSSNLKKVS